MRIFHQYIVLLGLCGALLPSLGAGKKLDKKEEQIVTPTSAPVVTQKPEHAGIVYDASWSKQAYMITDSVALGAKGALKKSFKGWKLTVDGHESMGVSEATRLVKGNKTLPPIVIIAVGYNSSWEKDRKNFERYTKQFDDQAEAMLKAVLARGAKKVVWVLLRDPMASPSGKKTHKYYEKKGFYFGYVNERLLALHERHPEVSIADWASASVDSSYTADGIHLTAVGAAVLAEVIKTSVGL
jgi:lysophospholipase L1-like esterase